MSKQSSGLKSIGYGVISGLIVAVISFVVSTYLYRRSVANEIHRGVQLMEPSETVVNLQNIMSECQLLTIAINGRKPTPEEQLLNEVRQAVDSLSRNIDRIKTTEAYSGDEILRLASNLAFRSEREDFIHEHTGKPKRVVTGHWQLKPQIEMIDKKLDRIAEQLGKEPNVDEDSLRNAIGEITRLTSATDASLKASYDRVTKTLKPFLRK